MNSLTSSCVCLKGIEDPELDQEDDDDVIYHPHAQEITELSESEMEETDEVLFEPPPMFARYCQY